MNEQNTDNIKMFKLKHFKKELFQGFLCHSHHCIMSPFGLMTLQDAKGERLQRGRFCRQTLSELNHEDVIAVVWFYIFLLKYGPFIKNTLFEGKHVALNTVSSRIQVSFKRRKIAVPFVTLKGLSWLVTHYCSFENYTVGKKQIRCESYFRQERGNEETEDFKKRRKPMNLMENIWSSFWNI